jgi:hypothetical protein
LSLKLKFHETKENKMFKKSLLAASLVLAVTNASAAALDNTANTGKTEVYGKEFIQNEATGVAVPSMTATLGAQYSVGDIVRLKVSGAEIDTTNTTGATATFAAGTSGATMTLGLLSVSASEAVFRVTVATGDHSNNGDATIAFTGLKLTTASLMTASTVSATYAPETSTGIAIDVASANTFKILKGVEQYNASTAVAADNFDAVISTGSLRSNFGTGVYADTVKVSFPGYTIGANENAYAAHMGAAPSASKVTVKGDFSFLDTSGDGKVTSADAIAAPLATAGAASAVAFATDLQSIVVTGPTAFTDAGVAVTAGNAAAGTTITAQSFTTDTELSFAAKTGGTVKKTTSLSAGSWTLDGSSTKIAFLPFGSDYAQSITVTNTGSVEGAITVDLFYNGMKYTKTLTAVAAAKAVTNISLEVAAFAAESGITDNAQITVTTNAPGIVVKGL